MSLDWSRASRFSGPEDSLGFLLWQATHRWQRAIGAALAPLGLTHLQFVLLTGTGWLCRDGGAPTQIELAGFTRVEPMQVSQVVRLLEKKKLLARAPHPTDSRAKALKLTAAGEKLVQRAVPLVEAADADFFASSARPALLRQLRTLAAI
ncbi:MAG: MarR family winged helix-turn-helix transcriptional regulator [Candidatus Eiseniibacteriota bacterium]